VKQIPRARKLVISSNSSRGNVSQALQRHCDAFLVKPVSNDALTAALQKIGTTPQPAAK
jgi:DNA-binding NarL/FixJ family response regulator